MTTTNETNKKANQTKANQKPALSKAELLSMLASMEDVSTDDIASIQQAKIKASQKYVDEAQKLQENIIEQKKEQVKLNAELTKAAEYTNKVKTSIDQSENEKIKYAKCNAAS